MFDVKKKKTDLAFSGNSEPDIVLRQNPERLCNTDTLQIIREEHNPKIVLLKQVIHFRKPEGRN